MSETNKNEIMLIKGRSSIYIGASVLLVMLAVAATAIVNQTQNNGKAGSEDIRAKAGVSATLKARGVVSLVDNNTGRLVVNNLRFVESAGGSSDRDLGSWTVTPPVGFSLSGVSIGNIVTLTLDPSTFLATYHTLTATQIIVGQ